MIELYVRNLFNNPSTAAPVSGMLYRLPMILLWRLFAAGPTLPARRCSELLIEFCSAYCGMTFLNCRLATLWPAWSPRLRPILSTWASLWWQPILHRPGIFPWDDFGIQQAARRGLQLPLPQPSVRTHLSMHFPMLTSVCNWSCCSSPPRTIVRDKCAMQLLAS